MLKEVRQRRRVKWLPSPGDGAWFPVSSQVTVPSAAPVGSSTHLTAGGKVVEGARVGGWLQGPFPSPV